MNTNFAIESSLNVFTGLVLTRTKTDLKSAGEILTDSFTNIFLLVHLNSIKISSADIRTVYKHSSLF